MRQNHLPHFFIFLGLHTCFSFLTVTSHFLHMYFGSVVTIRSLSLQAVLPISFYRFKNNNRRKGEKVWWKSKEQGVGSKDRL